MEESAQNKTQMKCTGFLGSFSRDLDDGYSLWLLVLNKLAHSAIWGAKSNK